MAAAPAARIVCDQRQRAPICRTCRDANTGETNWDDVIDAEMARRKLLEDSPIPCSECTRCPGQCSLMPAPAFAT